MPQWLDDIVTMIAQTYFRLTHPLRLASAQIQARRRHGAHDPRSR